MDCRRVENGPPDAGLVELHQRAVALLDLNNAVLDCHVVLTIHERLRLTMQFASARCPFLEAGP